MGITRRSLLQLMAGASAGAMVSPLPWKLLDDVSIWTQNWFLTAKLPRGETKYEFAACGQCSGGCGIRVRTLGGEPISITGQDSHPGSHGGVCALGMGSPELRFHPLRIAKSLMKNSSGEFAQAETTTVLARIGKELAACKADPASGMAAVLDWRPGSAMSALYRELLDGAGGGHHLVAPTPQSVIQNAMAKMFESPVRAGYDFASTKTVLSLGAPLFEGYGSLGRMSGIGSVWRRMNRVDRPQVIHADPNCSITASMADRWLPIKPGTEAALALAIGHVLIKQNLVKDAATRINDLDAYTQLVESYSPAKAAKITGIDASMIIQVARDFATKGPAIAVAGSGSGSGPVGQTEEIAAMGLNILTGSLGTEGGVLPLQAWPPKAPVVVEQPGPEDISAAQQSEGEHLTPPTNPVDQQYFAKSLENVADGSIRLLIIDGQSPDAALPFRLVQKKLAKNALTVSMNPYITGTSLNADIVLPSAVAFEWEFDVPTAPLAAKASYSISPKLCDPPAGLTAPTDLVMLMAKGAGIQIDAGAYKKHMNANFEAIVTYGKGQVFDPKSGKQKPVSSFKSADKLYKALAGGGTWTDETVPGSLTSKANLAGNLNNTQADRVSRLAGTAGEYPLILMPYGNHGEAGGNAMPRLLSKLYRESNLRQLFNTVHLNPETGAKSGLTDGCSGELKTATGTLKVDVVYDKAVMPGVARIAVTPNPLDFGDVEKGDYASILEVTEIGKDGVWRLTRASLKEVHHV